jgi:orotidine-5'-phosphate decarboxylase
MTNPSDSLIVALDVDSGQQAIELANVLAPATRQFKIGSYLFTLEGPPLVRQLVKLGCQVFLDLKFHDIPEVVAGAVRNAALLGVSMLTVHISGGPQMLRAAASAAGQVPSGTRPLLAGVTVLTSLSADQWKEVFPQECLTVSVVRLAEMAQSAGLGGLVCSPHELVELKNIRLRKIVPGIRPPGSATNDQRRTMTPADAIAAGADCLVVGRPIIRSADPLQAAMRIKREIETNRR